MNKLAEVGVGLGLGSDPTVRFADKADIEPGVGIGVGLGDGVAMGVGKGIGVGLGVGFPDVAGGSAPLIVSLRGLPHPLSCTMSAATRTKPSARVGRATIHLRFSVSCSC